MIMIMTIIVTITAIITTITITRRHPDLRRHALYMLSIYIYIYIYIYTRLFIRFGRRSRWPAWGRAAPSPGRDEEASLFVCLLSVIYSSLVFCFKQLFIICYVLTIISFHFSFNGEASLFSGNATLLPGSCCQEILPLCRET